MEEIGKHEKAKNIIMEYPEDFRALYLTYPLEKRLSKLSQHL